MSTGIHHVTGITRRVQANVDFYGRAFWAFGWSSARAVMRMPNSCTCSMAMRLARPGQSITFLVWEDGAPGRIGHGQVAEIALAVPPDSIGDWLTRAMTARIPVEGPSREFGETVLRLKDPDGVIIKLVGADMPAAAPLPDPIAPTRLRAVTVFTEKADETRDFLASFGGMLRRTSEGAIRRSGIDTDVIDIRDATGFFAGIPGTGVLDHSLSGRLTSMRCGRCGWR